MNLLFLCTGNSCRSQIAEGWARHLGDAKVNVMSAGIEAHGKNPRAISVMAESGVDIAAQESTKLTDEMLTDYLSRRLYKARALLESAAVSVSEAAYRVGFASPAYFSRVFFDDRGRRLQRPVGRGKGQYREER